METKPKSNNKAEYYAVSSLRLDNLNPRLPDEAKKYSQVELLMYMEEKYDLLPIARSMSDNGYFDEEPVIITEKKDEPGVYIVIEGNRRLAALKFLTNPDLRAKSEYKKEYEELADSAKENLLEIPAVKYEDREETAAMLGFRHITGIMKWVPFLKAEFVHSFVTSNPNSTFQETARMLGDSTYQVRRDYATYSIYLQAKENKIDTSKLLKEFSIFYTALGRLPFQRFIGFQISGGTVDELKTPVPETKINNLKEMIKWVHGIEGKDPIIGESRDLKELAEVLDSEEALKRLREGATLANAYSVTITEEKAVADFLSKASYNIEESLRYIHRHYDDPDVQKEIYRCAVSLIQALKYFPDVMKELRKSLVGKKQSD